MKALLDLASVFGNVSALNAAKHILSLLLKKQPLIRLSL